MAPETEGQGTIALGIGSRCIWFRSAIPKGRHSEGSAILKAVIHGRCRSRLVLDIATTRRLTLTLSLILTLTVSLTVSCYSWKWLKMAAHRNGGPTPFYLAYKSYDEHRPNVTSARTTSFCYHYCEQTGALVNARFCNGGSIQPLPFLSLTLPSPSHSFELNNELNSELNNKKEKLCLISIKYMIGRERGDQSCLLRG